MLNKITGYNKVLTQHGYHHNGAGVKPWAVRHIHTDGTCVDVRNTEWTYYTTTGKEEATGNNADALNEFLCGF